MTTTTTPVTTSSSTALSEIAELRELGGQVFCLDLETAMAPTCFGGRDHVRLLQVGNEDGVGYVDLQTLDDDGWDCLADWLEDPGLTIIGHNISFDYRCLLGCGIQLRGKLEDTMKMSQILWNGMPEVRHGLEPLVKRVFGVRLDKSHQNDDWMRAELSESQIAYALGDVTYTWKAWRELQGQILQEGLGPVYRLECALIPVTVEMEHTGLPLDRVQLDEVLKEYGNRIPPAKAELLELIDGHLTEAGHEGLPRDADGSFNTRPKATGYVRDGSKRTAGFNMGSPAQMLRVLNQLDIEPVDRKTGKATTDKKVLRRFANHPVVASYLSLRADEKRCQMVEGLKEKADWSRGRVFARLDPLNTGTGRFACVSGDTLLPTSRGLVRFDEYLPQEGDKVLTHAGRWMPVLRKIFKGYEQMYRVQNQLGGKLTCTGGHRLLTPNGWVRVRDLQPGDDLVYLPSVCGESGQRAGCVGAVQERREADTERDGRAVGYALPQHLAHSQEAHVAGGVSRREGTAVLTLESRGPEPYAGQEWRPAPQLQGERTGPERVYDGAEWEGQAGVHTPAGDGGSPWVGLPSEALGSASHRWQSVEQLIGQLGAGDESGAWCATCEITQVAEIAPVGVMGVWDIEVGGDHSYATFGFLNHNSSGPNLQNLPRDAFVRDIVAVPPGFDLIQLDVSAMEMAVAASASIANEVKLQHALNEGLDVHTRTATFMFGCKEDEVTKAQRQASKSTNFGCLYGSGAGGLMDYMASLGMFVSYDEANDLRNRWMAAYPAFPLWHRRCEDELQRTGAVRMVDGRRRWLHGDMARPTVVANNKVQGTSASIIKRAMRLIWSWKEAHQPEARIILQVHDELLAQVPEGTGEALARFAEGAITQAGREIIGDSVLLRAEAHIGKAWGQCK